MVPGRIRGSPRRCCCRTRTQLLRSSSRCRGSGRQGGQCRRLPRHVSDEVTAEGWEIVVEFLLEPLGANPHVVGHPLRRELEGLWSPRRASTGSSMRSTRRNIGWSSYTSSIEPTCTGRGDRGTRSTASQSGLGLSPAPRDVGGRLALDLGVDSAAAVAPVEVAATVSIESGRSRAARSVSAAGLRGRSWRGWSSRRRQRSWMKSSAVSSAWRRIERSVPLASSRWRGTMTVAPSSRRSLTWLPR